MVVIGDVAGQYEALVELLKKCPRSKHIVFLGDLNDRGPDSAKVISLVKALVEANIATCLKSNHGHMFTEYFHKRYSYYAAGVFLGNGGQSTIDSYYTLDTAKEHVAFLESVPMYLKTENFLLSHAPVHISKTLADLEDIGTGFTGSHFGDYNSDISLLWNRQVPNKKHKSLKELINIFGHNSSDAVKVYCQRYSKGIKCFTNEDLNGIINNNKCWGICIDTSGGEKLTALDTDTMTIYEQDYLWK